LLKATTGEEEEEAEEANLSEALKKHLLPGAAILYANAVSMAQRERESSEYQVQQVASGHGHRAQV
jgi:hypothetical protein